MLSPSDLSSSSRTGTILKDIWATTIMRKTWILVFSSSSSTRASTESCTTSFSLTRWTCPKPWVVEVSKLTIASEFCLETWICRIKSTLHQGSLMKRLWKPALYSVPSLKASAWCACYSWLTQSTTLVWITQIVARFQMKISARWLKFWWLVVPLKRFTSLRKTLRRETKSWD